jgi:hypothetical protein
MAISPIINKFNGGEYSPKIDCREDLEKYYSGCRLMENMYAEPYGDASNQPGTYFVNEVKDSSKRTILLPFKHSTGQSYQLEFGDSYIRFYMNRAQVVYTTLTIDAQPAGGDWSVGDILTGGTSGVTCEVVAVVSSTVYTVKHVTGDWTDGEVITAQDSNARDCGAGYPTVADSTTPCEVVSPYAEDDLYGLQYKQSADVMLITHIDHEYPVYKLSRTAHDDWTMEAVDFEYGPFMPQNKTDITITPPAEGTDVASGQNYNSSSEYPGYTVAKAFDDIVEGVNGWLGTSATDEWISLYFSVAKTIKRVRIQPCYYMGYSSKNVRYCKIQGLVGGGEWTDIPVIAWKGRCQPYNTDEIEIAQINNYTDWADVILDNDTAYDYYRVYCHQNWGGGAYMSIKEVEMMEDAGDSYVASDDIFTSDHVGALWQLIHNMAESEVSGSFGIADDFSASLRIFGTWRFITEGTWIGKVQIQRSYDGGTTWKAYQTYSRSTSTGLNYNVPGDEEIEDVLYRIYMTEWESGTCHYCLSVDDSSVSGIVKITEYVSATEVKAEIIKALADGSGSVATTEWSEGAWSEVRGYPGTVEIFEERTVFGGSAHQPHTLWFSKTNDWYNMRAGTLSDSALIYNLPCTEPIKWLTSHDVLLIGTKGDEWRLGSSDPTKPLTPEDSSAPRRQTGYGSADIQSILIGNIVIFLQRMKKKVWGTRYYFEKGEAGGYDAEDMTLLAEHIAGSGIIQMTYQNQPESVLWCVNSDGNIIGMSFQPKEIVVGWHRHTTEGTYESVSAIPTATGEDELWAIVNRTIGGETKRYIEYFMPRDWGTDQKDCFFVHSGLTFDGGDAVDITDISVGADPFRVTVTAAAHGRTNGDQVKIVDVGGMTDVNNKVYTVSDKTTDTFILKDKTNSVYITGENFGAYTSGGTIQKVDNVFAGLNHLAEKTVAVLADGAVHEQTDVSSDGHITLNVYANKVHAGLPYTAKLMPMKIAFPTGKGSTRGDIKRINEILFSFYNTLGAKFGTNEGSEQINFRKVTDEMGAAIPLFTGIKRQTFPGGYELDGDIYIEQDQPLPITIRAIIPKLRIYDE